ncbi:hypothetical protein CHLV4088_00825 [Campylobacter helveticus]|uniref:formyltransferase family protein n=1 Tax=Campylobacter helveticus TaxID=28898 RepID=UPI00214A532D|nr:hypothetical protein [Campylobacter helveticus]
MKIALVTSPNQWFYKEALEFAKKLGADFFDSYEKVRGYELVFILSYHRIIPPNLLTHNKHNLVIHASKLPQGKGWSPMFHQILEGKNTIEFSLFEASAGVDSGDIYLQNWLDVIYKQSGDESCQWLKPSEHLSYQMPQEPFSINEQDFKKVVLDFMLFENGIDKKEFEKAMLESLLYDSKIELKDSEILVRFDKDKEVDTRKKPSQKSLFDKEEE